jgi:anti-sigma B factor antagonist
LEAAIDACLADTQALVLDLHGLEYISSAGLRVLLKAQKSMAQKGSMKVLNANETIMEVFEITGFTDILTIE